MTATPLAWASDVRPGPGTKLLGEVVAWGCPGVAVRHSHLIDALTDAELDASVARELAPRHAFARACRRLGEARIIRQVAEDQNAITFQFTAESRDGERYEYDFETLLTLDKATGKVDCPIPGLATMAREELDRCTDARTGSDITRVVKKLFEQEADLFAIRPGGGAYFVPDRHAAFTRRVQTMLGRIGGEMYRFPVPTGTAQGDRSVREAVACGIAAMIDEHAQAVEGFGSDTRPATLERAAERIRATRFKLEAYSEYLAGERVRLEDALAEAATALREKVGSLAIPA